MRPQEVNRRIFAQLFIVMAWLCIVMLRLCGKKSMPWWTDRERL